MAQSLLITPEGDEILLPDAAGGWNNGGIEAVEEIARDAFEALHKTWLAEKGGNLQVEDDEIAMEELGWLALYPVVLAERPIEEKSRWRKAAYIAWEAWPGERYPATKEQFARKIGLRSGRQLYQWRSKDRTINEQIEALWRALITDEVRSVDRVGLKVAKDPSYRTTQERRLFYQRQGVMAEDNTLLLRTALDPRSMDEEQLDEWIKAAEAVSEDDGMIEANMDDGERGDGD